MAGNLIIRLGRIWGAVSGGQAGEPGRAGRYGLGQLQVAGWPLLDDLILAVVAGDGRGVAREGGAQLVAAAVCSGRHLGQRQHELTDECGRIGPREARERRA